MPGHSRHFTLAGGFPSLLDEIIERAPIGVAVIDFDGCYRTVNPAYCEIYGYAASAMLGGSFTMVLAPTERAAILARHQEFLLHGGALKGEFRVQRRDGSVLQVVVDSVKIPGDDARGLRLVYVVDVTERRRMEASLRSAADTYRTLFETVPQGIIYFDLEGQITTANPAALRILGLDFDQLVGKGSHVALWQFMHPDGTPFRADEFPNAIAHRTGEPARGIVMGFEAGKRGSVWIEVSAVPLFKAGSCDQVYACFEDITERMIRSRALEQKATTDFLTGTANRATVIERLTAEWQRLRRHPETRCAVLLLDLDFFKHVNDTWGHAAGDAVLKHVSAQFIAASRTGDLVGRIGGEEFLLVLADTGLESALTLAERLCERVAKRPTVFEGHTIPVTVSAGASAIRGDDASIDEVLGRADQALYEAKGTGRNRVLAHVTLGQSD
jgi:diguanylate cyclase (GGDEF)-like protein/PAS domain S-box-containing protein